MPYRLPSRRFAALVIAVALVVLPATVSTAAEPVAHAPIATFWSQVWSQFGGLFAGWFAPPGNDRVTASDQTGSLLDPDGSAGESAFTDTTNATAPPGNPGKGDSGSLLDPDGTAAN